MKWRNYRSLVVLCVMGAVGPVFSGGTGSAAPGDNSFYRDSIQKNPAVLFTPPDTETPFPASALYHDLRLDSFGLKEEVFAYALKGYRELLQKGRIRNTGVISICDFSQSSRKKRLYVIDLESPEVLMHTHVAHGRGSGGEYATSFSNTPQSHKSSLGFYVTDKTYSGSHGLSLKIRGVEKGFNDKAWDRAVVIHGAAYVSDRFLRDNRFLGRSFGCPAVSFRDHRKLINTIRNGSCLFVYHPTKTYLAQSKILNS